MSLNFAGSVPQNTISSQHLRYFDSRYINTDEKIPQVEKNVNQLAKLETRVAALERRFQGFQTVLLDIHRNLPGLQTRVTALETDSSKVTALRTDFNAMKLIVDVMFNACSEVAPLQQKLSIVTQRTKLLEDNQLTERRKLAGLKEAFDAKIARMSMLELENILERMATTERNIASMASAFNTKVTELNTLHQNFKTLTRHEVGVIKEMITGILRELENKAEKPFYKKILEEIERKLQSP